MIGEEGGEVGGGLAGGGVQDALAVALFAGDELGQGGGVAVGGADRGEPGGAGLGGGGVADGEDGKVAAGVSWANAAIAWALVKATASTPARSRRTPGMERASSTGATMAAWPRAATRAAVASASAPCG